MTNPRKIKRLMMEARPPDASKARERTAAAARSAAAVQAEAGASRAFACPAISAALVTALLAFSFTPPGRAVTGEVAELMGIGGPATIDHDEQRRPLEPTTDEIVISSGRTADGERYEIVAFEGRRSDQEMDRHEVQRRQILEDLRAAREETGADLPAPPALPEIQTFEGTCIAVDWIDQPESNGGTTCIDGPQNDALHIGGSTDSEGRYGPAAQLIIEGMTGPEVARVEVSYERPDGERIVADGSLGRLTPELAEQIGTSMEFGHFVAFIPDLDVGPGGNFADVAFTVQAVAYGDDGEEIEREDYPAMPERARADSQERNRGLVPFGEGKVLPLLDRSGIPVPGSRDLGFLRSAKGCPEPTQLLNDAGLEFDAYAGTACPDLGAVRAFIASGPSIP